MIVRDLDLQDSSDPSLQSKIEKCYENVTICESNLAQEKNFTIVQKEENRKLKKIIFYTRKNNQFLMEKISSLKDVMALLQKQNQELKMKVEKLQQERIAEMKNNFKFLMENLSNRERILELQTFQSKADLENCKMAAADFARSERELNQCNVKLKAELKKQFECESQKKICEDEIVSKDRKIQELNSENTKITLKMQSQNAQNIITKQELHDCEEELEDEIQKNKNLQTQNSKSLKILEESKSNAAADRRRAQECQNKLKDEIEAKEVLEKKYESVCPSWSEWSSCSKNCSGVKTRIDKCSIHDEEIEPCNDSCLASGKSAGFVL